MAFMIEDAVASAEGLSDLEREALRSLVATWRRKLARNELRERYYHEHVTPRSLGISVPPKVKVKATCGWPRKAVDYIASRSVFDRYTTSDEEAAEQLRQVVADNDLKGAYLMAATSELMHCCSFLTVTKGREDAGEPPVIVSMAPATAAAAEWDDRSRQVSAGMTVVRCERKRGRTTPTWIDLYLPGSVTSVELAGRRWQVTARAEQSMGRSVMVALANSPTLMRPFGTSLITRSVMLLSDNYMREAVRSEVAAEFSASPQKYLLGADKSQLGEQSKYDAYIGSIFGVTRGKDGSVPNFGQLPQPSMQPHIDYNRSLAAQFSGETNVPLSALGVVSDNPSSAEAIYATKEDAVIQVQRLNASNGRALVDVGYMALAVLNGTDYATERARVPDLGVHFADPSTPSVVSMSDALVKQGQLLPWLGETEVALEKLGYTDEEIRRLKSDKRRLEARDRANIMLGGQAERQSDGAAVA